MSRTAWVSPGGESRMKSWATLASRLMAPAVSLTQAMSSAARLNGALERWSSVISGSLMPMAGQDTVFRWPYAATGRLDLSILDTALIGAFAQPSHYAGRKEVDAGDEQQTEPQQPAIRM